MAINKVLIPIDVDESSQTILDKTIELFSDSKYEVWLIHITEKDEYFFNFNTTYLDPEFQIFEIGSHFSRDDRAKQLRIKHLQFTKYVDYLNDKEIKTKGLFISGSITKAVEAKTNKLDIDLIILGKHKRGKLMSLFSNNVAEKIVEQSHVPVVIIPI